MGLSLKLHAQRPECLSQLEAAGASRPARISSYLYDNTIGDGPYNAWVDPILTDEWQLIGWKNVSEMTKFGMPGVFAQGTFDTWSPAI
jgi:hypothetical protein